MAPPRYAPNAEWADWLQEEGDRKLAQGSKSADTYFRASKALRKHEQPLIHPSQARAISGIGASCMGIITSRLRQKCQETGDPFPAEPPRKKRKQPLQNSSGEPAKRTKSTGSRKPRQTGGLTQEELRLDDPNHSPEPARVDWLDLTSSQTAAQTPSGSRLTAPSDTGPSQLGSEAGLSDAQSKSRSKRRVGGPTAKARAEEYRPKPRTGGWGLLVGMYILFNKEIRWYTKLEIITRAQEYCDSSYTETAARGGGAGNSGYYTAWKNVDKLREEGYVEPKGCRPQKYMITQQGYKLASVLANIENISPASIDLSKLPVGFRTSAATSQSQDPAPDLWPSKAKQSVDARPAPHSQVPSQRFAASSALDTRGEKSTASVPAMKSSVFEFWYLDNANIQVRNLDDADTAMHDVSYETLYKVVFYKSQSSHPFKRNSIIREEPMPAAPTNGSKEALMMGWMRESKTIPRCPGFLATSSPSTVSSDSGLCSPLMASGSTIRETSSITSGASSFTIKDGSRSSGESRRAVSIAPEEADRQARAKAAEARRHDTQRQKARMQEARTQEAQTQEAQTQEPRTQEARRQNAHSTQPALFRIDSSVSPARISTDEVFCVDESLEEEEQTLNPTTPSCANEFLSRATALADVRSTLPTRKTGSILRRIPSGASATRSNSQCATFESQPEVWPAGTYDICLLLDHREVRSADDREGLYNLCREKAALAENPVQVSQRELVLGDALWIAVHRNSGREMVLDSIVERKRLDDLCSSIMDSRFEEQKARLRRSGLRDPIYLVETYNKQTNLEANGQMIYTSKAEVVVLNKFQLEETSDWKASVDHLMRRTEVLREIHKTVDLWIIPGKVDRSTYLEKLTELRKANPSRYWVTSYSDFEKLNHKSSNLTVRELWARMIYNLPGMSPEKVGSFVERWATPREFWDECQMRLEEVGQSQQRGDTKKAWQWIEEEFSGETRAIGTALSKRIWEMYNLSEYGLD